MGAKYAYQITPNETLVQNEIQEFLAKIDGINKTIGVIKQLAEQKKEKAEDVKELIEIKKEELAAVEATEAKIKEKIEKKKDQLKQGKEKQAEMLAGITKQ